MDLESMMQNMGGMDGGMENDKESSDSDDEDLPDLEWKESILYICSSLP